MHPFSKDVYWWSIYSTGNRKISYFHLNNRWIDQERGGERDRSWLVSSCTYSNEHFELPWSFLACLIRHAYDKQIFLTLLLYGQ